MKICLLKMLYLSTILISISQFSFGQTSFRFKPSIVYYRDLSDTFGGGGLLNGEFEVSRNWYGICLSFGHFQSQSTFILKVPVQEINSFLPVPIDEISFMKIGSVSGLIMPINRHWINAEIEFGVCLNASKSLYFKEVKYSYDLNDQKFTELIRDYQLEKTFHAGYQLGFNISFYPLKKAGIQLSVRMQDLKKSGSFFFVGGGLSFKI